MHQHSHQLSASHDELRHHVHIVIPARAQFGWGLLTRSKALIQLQAEAFDKAFYEAKSMLFDDLQWFLVSDQT